jgi:gliding motility-associated-like protein
MSILLLDFWSVIAKYMTKSFLFSCVMFCFFVQDISAEGSKDFIDYPGHRLFLDTRDPQQLKVFANAGEFINVGSSHIGINQGYIDVFRPDGTLHTRFNNIGTNAGKGVINRLSEEQNGPIGGGVGYEPGVVQVDADSEGVWTVVFDYPSYQQSTFQNILNNAPWERLGNQPGSRTVVLAWDVTITQGAAGNMGGSPVEGRLYSNEHISLLFGNGVTTSPLFYVFTVDGYLYEVKFNATDPYRFPISSNSLGLVTGDVMPIYKSKPETDFRRDDDPSSWSSDSLYLYEPQAEDFAQFVNNKLFFNIPDVNMPATAMNTDIYRGNTHETWLYSELLQLEIESFYFIGFDPDDIGCPENVMELDGGGWFVIEANSGGQAVIELDLNNNGSFDDPEDQIIMEAVSLGIDSIYWDGRDGLGNPIPVDPVFNLSYKGQIRYGEIHISMTDIEANNGGVTFKLLNAPPNVEDDLFLYDHSDIGGTVSGGGTPGNALPTTTPFTYSAPFGNNRFMDQWIFTEFVITPTSIIIEIVPDCPCDALGAAPGIFIEEDDVAFCEGEDIQLSATNHPDSSIININEITYTWTGPNGFFFQEVLLPNDTSNVNLTNLTETFEGIYSVTTESDLGCTDGPDSIQLEVFPNITIGGVSGGGDYCEGDVLTLSASNTNSNVDSITYTWTGPDGYVFSATVAGDESLSTTISDLNSDNEGTYVLSMVTTDGCVAADISVQVGVKGNPVLESTGGGGNFCIGDSTTLTAISNVPGMASITYTWTGPNGYFFQNTVPGNEPLTAALTNMNGTFSGCYILNATSDIGCVADPDTVCLIVNPIPEISNIAGGGDYCEGETIQLTAQNFVIGIDSITYTWTGPNGFSFANTVAGNESFIVDIPNADINASGIYTLQLVSNVGCMSIPQSVTVNINPVPQIDGINTGVFCTGTDITLSAMNSNPGTAVCTYTWTGPNGFFFQGTADSDGPYEVTITNLDPSDAGNYILTLACDGGCTSLPDTANIEIADGLELDLLTEDGIICAGNDLVLTATNTVTVDSVFYTWTGPNGFMYTDTTDFDGPFSTTISADFVTQSGDYIISITSPNGCNDDPDTVNIVVFNELVITDLEGGGNYCVGEFVTLNGTNTIDVDTVIYTWTGPNGFSFTDTTDKDGPFIFVFDSITLDQAGDYTLNITTSNGCAADPATVTVSVDDLPVITNVPTEIEICEGDDLLLSANNSTQGISGITYTWIAPDGSTFVGNAGPNDDFDWLIPNAQMSNSGTYTLFLVTTAGCQSDSASVDVIINPTPEIIDLTDGGTFCEGTNEDILLSGMNSTMGIDSMGYLWEINNTTLSIGVTSVIEGPFQTTINTNNAASGTYTLTLISDKGCTDSEAVVITINEQPEITDLTADTTVCMFADLVLTGFDNNTTSTEDVNYQWTGPTGSVLINGTAPASGPFEYTISNVMMNDAGEYCLTLTSQDGCVSEIKCVEISVLPTPVLEIIDGASDIYCEGDTAIITLVNVTPGIDSLYFTCLLPDGTFVVSEAAGDDTLIVIIPDLTILQGGSISCSSESFDGCISSLVMLDIVIQPNPIIQDISGGGDYCEGDDVLLSGVNFVQVPGDITYIWTGPNGVIFTGTAPVFGPFEATISDISLSEAGEYCLYIESEAGCGSDEVCVTINVNPSPEVVNPAGGGVFCEGDMTMISADILLNGSNSATYTVSGPGINETGLLTQDQTLSFDLTVDASTVGTYTITAISDEGCEAESAVVIVELNDVEFPNLQADPNPICEGDELTLTTQFYDGTDVSYEWFFNGSSIGITSVPSFSITAGTTGEYSVLVTVDGCNSEISASIGVEVYPNPTANNDNYTTLFNNPILGENVLTNDDTGNNGVTISIVSPPDNGTLDLNLTNGDFDYTSNLYFQGTDQFVYEICDVNCPENCSQATVTITIDPPDCNYPNVITPNGDGDNDEFWVDCLENNAFPENVIRIFNRWGDEIYFAEPYNNDWEGTRDNKPLPAGTYFFLLQLRPDQDEYQEGFITIVR